MVKYVEITSWKRSCERNRNISLSSLNTFKQTGSQYLNVWEKIALLDMKTILFYTLRSIEICVKNCDVCVFVCLGLNNEKT